MTVPSSADLKAYGVAAFSLRPSTVPFPEEELMCSFSRNKLATRTGPDLMLPKEASRVSVRVQVVLEEG